MAEIFQTTEGNDRVLILSPREGLVRPLNISTYTSIAIGGIFSSCSIADGNEAATGSTVTTTAPGIRDRFYFGLKSDGFDFPLENDCVFAGFGLKAGASSVTTFGSFNSLSLANIVPAVYHIDTSNILSLSSGTLEYGMGGNAFPVQYTYFTPRYPFFFCIRYTILNKGTNTQSISIDFRYNNGYINPSLSYNDSFGTNNENFLRTELDGEYTTGKTFSYRDLSNNPYPLPKTIFLHHYSNLYRVRVHAMGFKFIS